MKLVNAFRNFANGPKNPKHLKTLVEEGNVMNHVTKKRHLNTISNEKSQSKVSQKHNKFIFKFVNEALFTYFKVMLLFFD
jgi:hypothetical protein